MDLGISSALERRFGAFDRRGFGWPSLRLKRGSWLMASALLLVSGCGLIEQPGLLGPGRDFGLNRAPDYGTAMSSPSYSNSAVSSSAMPRLPDTGASPNMSAQPAPQAIVPQSSVLAYDEQTSGADTLYRGGEALQPSGSTPYLDLSAQRFSSTEVGSQLRALIAKRAETHPDWARQLDRFYTTYGYQPIWYRGAWSNEAKIAAASLSKSWADGLPPRRYLPSEGIALEQATSLQAVARNELALTQGMLLYLPELRGGLTTQSRDGLALLEAALASGDLGDALERMRPQTAQFQGLRKAVLTVPMDESAKRLIALNMHRFRQADAQIQTAGRHVRVNLPGYTLDAYDRGEHVMSMPVIVGQPDRATPILTDRIVNLKFSPDWSVPPVAAGEDLLPLLKHDAKALVDKMGLQAFRNGQAVNPLSVDWNRYSASNLPFTFRQRPGPKNAMGGVRFSLTNPQDIYLHDTPERALFGEKVRMISSGCVRLAEAEKLAAWILASDQGWSRSQVRRAMQSGDTRIQPLKQPVSVDLVYYTALIDAKGGLQLYPDIYGKDAELAAQLGL